MALAYTAPSWTDGSGTGISASQLQALCDCVEGLVQGSDKAIHNISFSGSTMTFTFADGSQETAQTTVKGISSITKTGTSGLVDTYTITFTDGTTSTYTVTNGAKGDTGECPSITVTATADATSSQTPSVSVTKTGTDEAPTFAMAFSGLKGAKGDTGQTGATGATPSITMSATADAQSSSTPSVQVTKTGTDENPAFALAFSGLKGAKGDTGQTGQTGATGATPNISMTATADALSSSTPSVQVTKTGTAEAPAFALAFSGLKGAKGDKGDEFAVVSEIRAIQDTTSPDYPGFKIDGEFYYNGDHPSSGSGFQLTYYETQLIKQDGGAAYAKTITNGSGTCSFGYFETGKIQLVDEWADLEKYTLITKIYKDSTKAQLLTCSMMNIGATGRRGSGIYKTTTAPSSYSTQVGDFTPTYRMALSTIMSEAGISEVYAGDVVEYSYYHYPIHVVDTDYAYMGARVSIRGATGSTGTAAGFGTPTASIDANVGTPSVTVTASGSNTAKVFDFAFSNIKGQTGATGADGVSPEVTITAITGGHRVKITDADHPSGQTFDVMDGTGAGDMLSSVYDALGAVATAGGITDYVAGAITGKANKPTVLTATLATPNTQVTFTNAAITANAKIRVYTNVPGLNYESMDASTANTIVLTYEAQNSNITVMLEIS